ncbi:hypothetical protein ACCO45_001408 [Purpureocillium lilacinum]|uniref:Uncharacterized protein n=1 Tax=Purpureocillium lilacinum TaxID=33203 RepID=A0ACC4E8C8_PURLI
MKRWSAAAAVRSNLVETPRHLGLSSDWYLPTYMIVRSPLDGGSFRASSSAGEAQQPASPKAISPAPPPVAEARMRARRDEDLLLDPVSSSARSVAWHGMGGPPSRILRPCLGAGWLALFLQPGTCTMYLAAAVSSAVRNIACFSDVCVDTTPEIRTDERAGGAPDRSATGRADDGSMAGRQVIWPMARGWLQLRLRLMATNSRHSRPQPPTYSPLTPRARASSSPPSHPFPCLAGRPASTPSSGAQKR